MLNEIINNEFNGTITLPQLRTGIRADLARLLAEKKFNHSHEVVKLFGGIVERLMQNTILPSELRVSVVEIVMSILFELWRNSHEPRQFFEDLRSQFAPPYLAALMSVCFSGPSLDWLLDFLSTIERSKRKTRSTVKTIGIYYPRFFGGGVERFLSMIIPIYRRMGYKIVFFTDVSDEQLEYELPRRGGGCAGSVSLNAGGSFGSTYGTRGLHQPI